MQGVVTLIFQVIVTLVLMFMWVYTAWLFMPPLNPPRLEDSAQARGVYHARHLHPHQVQEWRKEWIGYMIYNLIVYPITEPVSLH